jgi:hypothetical protein
MSEPHQRAIGGAGLDQFGMRPFGGDSAIGEHDDTVGGEDRGRGGSTRSAWSAAARRCRAGPGYCRSRDVRSRRRARWWRRRARADRHRRAGRGRGRALALAARQRDATVADAGLETIGRRSSNFARRCLVRAPREPASLAPGAVRRRLAASVSEKRKLSCGSTWTRRRNSVRSRSRTSRQPLRRSRCCTAPAAASTRRGRSAVRMLLPDPVAPTSATISPGAMRKERSCSTAAPSPSGATETWSRRQPSGPEGSGLGAREDAGSASSTSQIRAAEARASATIWSNWRDPLDPQHQRVDDEQRRDQRAQIEPAPARPARRRSRAPRHGRAR